MSSCSLVEFYDMGRILVLVLLVASVVVVHGAPDPLAKCAEGYNIPGVTVRCWDDGTARKCIEGYVYTCVLTDIF